MEKNLPPAEGVRKVVIIGPESTGKSTLSKELAGLFRTRYVPEYARGYINTLTCPYCEEDLLRIAEGQIAEEDRLLGAASEILICDTDLNVIRVWSEHKYGRCHPRILEHIAQRQYDLYLLTDIDIPWQDDPQREYPDPEMRRYFHHVYKDLVQNSGVPWAEISGTMTQRLARAAEIITGQFHIRPGGRGHGQTAANPGTGSDVMFPDNI